MHLRYDALANLSNVVRINVLADADLPARVATFYIEAGFAKKMHLVPLPWSSGGSAAHRTHHRWTVCTG
jgi:hypothetical protein